MMGTGDTGRMAAIAIAALAALVVTSMPASAAVQCPAGTCGPKGAVYAREMQFCRKEYCPSSAPVDLSTCSGNRDYCIQGSTSRGNNAGFCIAAYRACMQSGVWSTKGAMGRTVPGLARR